MCDKTDAAEARLYASTALLAACEANDPVRQYSRGLKATFPPDPTAGVAFDDLLRRFGGRGWI